MAKRRRVGLSMDVLEDRALLSTATAPPFPRGTVEVGSIHETRAKPPTAAAAARLQVLHGQAQGMIHAVVTPNVAGVNTLILATGPAQGFPGVVGLSSIQETEVRGNRLRVTLGSGSLRPLATPGHLLTFDYSGSGPVSRTGVAQRFTVSGAVTGGQGIYARSSGIFSATVVVNPQTGTLTIRYTLRVRSFTT